MKFQNLEIQTSKKEPNPWASKHQQANNQLRRITNKNQQRKSIARDFSFFGTCFPSISSKHKRKEEEKRNWTWSKQNLIIVKRSDRERRENYLRNFVIHQRESHALRWVARALLYRGGRKDHSEATVRGGKWGPPR